MNILFLSHVIEDESNGVWQKVKSQVDAFGHIGDSVDFVYLKNNKVAVLKIDNKVNEIRLFSKYFIFLKLIPYLKKNNYDLIYLRKPHGGFFPLTCSFLINIICKKNWSGKLILEIPTFPFKGESKGVKGLITNLIYNTFIRFSKKNINEVFYIGEKTDEIYGLPAIKIGNGVNFDNNKKTLSYRKLSNNSIRFLGVANLVYWHGFDRLINSIKNYKGKLNVEFIIVGEGEPELSKLKKIVNEYNLNENVKFYGKLNKSEIKDIITNVDICVDALGRHRSGNNVNDSLKSKEYLSLGMPFLKSHIDDSLDSSCFYFQVNADESDIDIDKVYSWIDSLPDDYHTKMVNFAKNNFTWESIFKTALILESK